MKLAVARAGTIPFLASLLLSCSGGSGGGSRAGPNRSPVLATAIPNQQAIVGHAFEFDVSQGGSSYTDPDGDKLTYTVTFPLPAPAGLSASGPIISGIPRDEGQFSATISVTDGRGGDEGAGILISIAPNSRPIVVNPNADRVLGATEVIDIEVTGGGSVFADADGDPLSYDVSFVHEGHGLSISSTRVIGMMSSVGLAHVRVVARDGAGGSVVDSFSLALPAPAPGPPLLPSTPFIYADDEIDLPFKYFESRQNRTFFPDTTPADNPTTNAGAALGRVLFYDRRVSITNTVSCGDCHKQSHGFSAGERFSTGALGLPQARNAMSLGNVRYNEIDLFFMDERARTLEQLVPIPIENPVELANPMGLLVPKLVATDFYPPLFEAAFGTPEITETRIARAIAQFLRAMISYRAESDEAFLVEFPGDIADPSLVFDAQEMRGLQVASDSFCFSCHASEVLILTAATNNGLDAAFSDPGAGRGRFRPSSLKNIGVTGPYMHDGRFATLREVIDFYDSGVQDSPHLDSFMRDFQTNRPRVLNLTDADKDALEAFLETLTDEALLADPRFSNPFQ